MWHAHTHTPLTPDRVLAYCDIREVFLPTILKKNPTENKCPLFLLEFSNIETPLYSVFLPEKLILVPTKNIYIYYKMFLQHSKKRFLYMIHSYT